jgi:hypothetical protein
LDRQFTNAFARPAARAAGRAVFGLAILLSPAASAAEKLDGFTAVAAAAALPDPAAEGWHSEAFAELAQAELKKLLAPLAAGQGALAPLRGHFALLPAVKPAASLPAATVRRGGAAQASPPAMLHEALAPVRSLFAPGVALHIKIKTVGVSLPPGDAGGDARTIHLVHLDGPSPRGRREINTTWRASWRKGGDASPQLRSLTCEAWEEVESSATHPWFSDQTAPVLRSATDAAEQFSAGNAHYRLRLQASLPFFKFGHHGVSIADVNGDGLDDLYVCQPGGLPNRLLLHLPDHTVTDASAAWGVDLLDSTQCALFADFDNDSDPDLAVATTGALVFLENTGRSFALRVRLPPVLNAYGLAAADYDRDGDTDLYAVRYFPSAGEGGELAVPVPQFDANNGGTNFLIRNDGTAAAGSWRTFSDATEESGLDANNHRFSYAAVWDDFNNDGLPDLYVANDFGRNNLFLQQRAPDGKPRFRDIADSAGLTGGAFGMSASSGDYNRDGWPDIHLGAMFSSAGSRITEQNRFRPDLSGELRGRFRHMARGNTLFANLAAPEGRFEDVSVQTGITVGRWSWASLFTDVDNDAWPDLLVANGFITGEIPDDL